MNNATKNGMALHSHFGVLPSNPVEIRDVLWEGFHQDILVIETKYQNASIQIWWLTIVGFYRGRPELPMNPWVNVSLLNTIDQCFC